jgi:hypothetical protein
VLDSNVFKTGKPLVIAETIKRHDRHRMDVRARRALPLFHVPAFRRGHGPKLPRMVIAAKLVWRS